VCKDDVKTSKGWRIKEGGKTKSGFRFQKFRLQHVRHEEAA